MCGFDSENLKAHIDDVAGTHAQVRLVYLFGSQVGGEVGLLSDVDLGVLLAPAEPLASNRAQLAHLFSAALEGVPVDLIILNQASIELAHAVIAQGKLLYQRDPAERVEYEADVLSRYGDHLPILRAQRQNILEGAWDERRVQRFREVLGRTQRALGTSGTPAR